MLGLVASAAALDLVVRANLSGDLRTVQGTVEVRDAGETAPRWIDPLARLTVPRDGRTRLWTLPAGPQPASVRWTRRADGVLDFVATLPRRNGDVGWSPDDGLRANGGWYPVPVDPDERPLRAHWDVTVVGPGLVVLNGVLAEPEPVLARARWTGDTDRLALAALPETGPYRATTVLSVPLLGRRGASPSATPPPDGRLTVVGRGTPPAGVLAGLREAAPAEDEADPVVIVVGHDDGRLAHAGPGVVYLSRRAFRTVPAFTRRWHRTAVRRARLAAGCLRCRDGSARDTRAALATLAAPEPRDTGLGRELVRGVDAVLSDPAIPAWADLRDRPWSREEDLGERLGAMQPAVAVARQLAALDPGIGAAVATALGNGTPLARAARDAGVPDDVVDAWWTPATPMNVLAVWNDAGVQIRREASEAAAPAVIPLVVDGAPRPWIARGDATTLELPGARRVQLDPDGAIAQDDRDDDRLPRAWSATVVGGLRSLDLDDGTFDAALQATVRHAGSTRRAVLATASHDAREHLSASVGALHGFGPLARPRERAWRATWSVGATWLADVPVSNDAVAAFGGMSLTRDTLGDRFLPLGGSVLGAAAQAGRTPDGSTAWWQLVATTSGVRPLHPRLALAGRLRGSVGAATLERRRLQLGGPRALRSLPQDAWFGDAVASSAVEARVRALRDASIPLGIGWLGEVHVSPGLEAGWGLRDGMPARVLGATAGLHASVDLAGLFPVRGGVTVAWPVLADGVDASAAQMAFEVDHAF
ncbi:MAG: hypothetical protein RLZZ299_2379 [Pseudomonadota bacterium]